MNQFLADRVGDLNKVLAWLLILGCPVYGAMRESSYGVISMSPQGFFIGLVAGIVLAGFICGVLALIVSMRDALHDIRGLLEQEPNGTEH